MRIQINPRSLLNLEHICEVLYKLHPSVLNDLVEMERSLGNVLGFIDCNNVTLEEREFLANIANEVNYSRNIEEPKKPEEFNELLKSKGVKVTSIKLDNKNDFLDVIKKINETNKTRELLKTIEEMKEDKNACRFHQLRKYIQLDTDEYIPMKIYVEVEDPVIGKKVKELVEALEKTRAPEQFYLHKKEVDEDAYFAEGYGLTMNEEQEKKFDDFFNGENVEDLERLLRKEKLYPLFNICLKIKLKLYK